MTVSRLSGTVFFILFYHCPISGRFSGENNMEVKACIFTDAGKVRKKNQDAALIKVANTKRHGRISFVAVCDGMGGLSRGEVASCKAIRSLENWFLEELPLMQDMEEEELWDTAEKSLRRLMTRCSCEIFRYGKHRGIKLGTTVTAFLQIGMRYMTFNIGDSRIYAIDRKSAVKLTRDQSVVQDKIEKGLITREESESDPQRNVLLQCLGNGRTAAADVTRGELPGSAVTVIACSDGFWRTIRKEEMHEKLCPQMCVSPEDMLWECKKLSERAMERKEEDNISVAAMCLEV